MAGTYASGRWQVQTGHEEEFIQRWREFLEWTRQDHPAMVDASLLRGTAEPGEFLSFSEWEDADARARWKNDPEFAQKMAACRALCEHMAGNDYERVVRIP